MWADGEAGESMVEAYTGETLVVVGEWHDRTFGAYSAGLPEHGQGFSRRCQEMVEESFELGDEVKPEPWPETWPELFY